MKSLLALFILTATLPVLANEPIIQCRGQTDPDYAHIDIYREGAKFIGVIFQESGDGDLVAFDVVELKRVGKEFVQVRGARPSKREVVRQPSRKSKEVTLSYERNGEGFLTGIGPTGDDFYSYEISESVTNVVCGRPNRRLLRDHD